MTSVAVLVPTWRRPEDLRRCLRALRSQRRRPDRVVVVRRPDDEQSATVLAAERDGLPVDEVIVREAGQVAALNAGLQALDEDVVAITDDDTAPRPDWIERIASWFSRDPALGALGGRDWVYQGGELQDGAEREVGRVAWYGRFLSFHSKGFGTPREVDFLKGANMSFRRRAIRGLRFDSRLRGRGAEYLNDWAFSLALKKRGWKIVYDEREVAHMRAFNETYIALRHLPGERALAHLAFALVVGTTVAPGPLLALARMKQLGGPAAAAAEIAGSWKARLGGALAGLRGRVRDH
jgi:GT2 family glycosyltransferase